MRELLDDVWPEVEAVAGALLKCRTLSGADVAAILAGVWHPPERRTPVRVHHVPGLDGVIDSITTEPEG